jgi:hypothetical protein
MYYHWSSIGRTGAACEPHVRDELPSKEETSNSNWQPLAHYCQYPRNKYLLCCEPGPVINKLPLGPVLGDYNSTTENKKGAGARASVSPGDESGRSDVTGSDSLDSAQWRSCTSDDFQSLSSDSELRNNQKPIASPRQARPPHATLRRHRSPPPFPTSSVTPGLLLFIIIIIFTNQSYSILSVRSVSVLVLINF